jgi:hypothetical protein
MDGVEHRQLTAQRTHGAIVSNIFHCKRPRFTSTAYSASLRKSHYDYATELFSGFVGGGLAVGVFERQHKLDDLQPFERGSASGSVPISGVMATSHKNHRVQRTIQTNH